MGLTRLIRGLSFTDPQYFHFEHVIPLFFDEGRKKAISVDIEMKFVREKNVFRAGFRVDLRQFLHQNRNFKCLKNRGILLRQILRKNMG